MLIRDQFGISYHHSQAGHILKACGWSSQKPVQRTNQRDVEAIPHRRQEEWSRIKKAIEEERTLAFIDQPGFYLLPGGGRTYGPAGQTPIIRAPLS
jgi:hypothetical protein